MFRYVITAALCLLALTSQTYAQDYTNESSGVYGYTSLNFDPSSNVVTAYSESDVDPDIQSYYEVNVSMSVQDQNGHTLADPSSSSYGTYTSVTYSFAGSPSSTYNATGLHYVMLSQEQEQCYETCQLYFIDYIDELLFEGLDINEPSIFDFTPDGQYTTTQNADVVLGQTYDHASLTTPAACGDERDSMITEYRTLNTPYLPQCGDFTQASPDSSWTFAQLNYGTYSWAIIGSYFTTGLDAVQNSVGTLTIQSAYRNPVKERSVATSANMHYPPGSRHQYGDAADLATGSQSTTFDSIRTAGINAGACGEPKANSGVGHVHLDWRQKAPAKWNTTCASTWLQ